jgi:WD40 repeat protein
MAAGDHTRSTAKVSLRLGLCLALALVWSIRAGAAEPVRIQLGGWVGALSFSADSRRLVVGSADNVARVFDAATGNLEAELEGHSDYVVTVALDPESKALATGSYDHTARIWDVATRQSRFVLRGHRGAVMSVAFSPDGQTLATGSIDGTVRLWNAKTGKLQKTLTGHKSWVNCVVFHPGGKLLASGSSDGTIRVWPLNEAAGAGRRSAGGDNVVSLRATKAEVRSIAFSRDGKHLAAGLRYGVIKLWDTADWKERLEFKGHEEDVWSVAFTPDSGRLLSGDGGWKKPGQVKVWSVATGELLATVPTSEEILSVAISPDGKLLAVGCRDKRVTIRSAPTTK